MHFPVIFLILSFSTLPSLPLCLSLFYLKKKIILLENDTSHLRNIKVAKFNTGITNDINNKICVLTFNNLRARRVNSQKIQQSGRKQVKRFIKETWYHRRIILYCQQTVDKTSHAVIADLVSNLKNVFFVYVYDESKTRTDYKIFISITQFSQYIPKIIMVGRLF